MMAKILIVGCGDIGTAVGVALQRDGHHIVGLKRRPPAQNLGIRYFQADLCRSADLASLETDFDQVIVIIAPDRVDEHTYQQLFGRGLENLLTIFSQKSPHTSFTFISSTSVYGQTHGEWVDESSTTEPTNFRGKIILEAEQSILSQQTNNTVIRFSGIYGQGRNRLIKLATKGGAIQHSPPYFTNRIHREDCISFIKFITDSKLSGQHVAPIYLASDDKPCPLWELVSWLADQLKAPQPVKKSITENANQNKRCNNQLIKKLGYRFKYPAYLDGYRGLVWPESAG